MQVSQSRLVTGPEAFNMGMSWQGNGGNDPPWVTKQLTVDWWQVGRWSSEMLPFGGLFSAYFVRHLKAVSFRGRVMEGDRRDMIPRKLSPFWPTYPAWSFKVFQTWNRCIYTSFSVCSTTRVLFKTNLQHTKIIKEISQTEHRKILIHTSFSTSNIQRGTLLFKKKTGGIMVKSHLQNQHETTPHLPKASCNGLIACLDWWFSILGISSTKGIVTLGYP